jgi:para-aminobenzoate synthetase / 4-amino-4-deoxychorismate lyase
LASTVDPLLAARWLRGEPGAVALAGAWASGRVLLSSHPVLVARDGDPFARLATQPSVDVGADRDFAVAGGWLGWLGFGLGRALEPVPPSPPRPQALPAFRLAFHDHVVRADEDGRWWFEALWTDARASVLEERLSTWKVRLAGPLPPAKPVAAEPLRIVVPGARGHAAAVAEAIERIAAGEVFQVNVCLRLEGAIEGDILDLWVRAGAASRPRYAAYVAGEDHVVASLSPELFLRQSGRDVRSEPIKGTATLEIDPQELARSPKDRAENVMIVDLMRNDLGRVCEYGTVTVPALCELRQAAGVWHLVSRVTGRLRDDAGPAELLRATFPPGSVTGAPKVQALRVISQLEATGREAYCGAMGLSSPLSGLELNVAIRTLETRAGRLWLGVGGGVVSDSTPAGEVAEAIAKARGVALAAGLRIDASGTLRANDGGTVVRHARPDPRHGIIETLAVAAGVCVAAPAHFARLRASAAALGLFAPDWLEEAADEAAAKLGSGRLRVAIDAAATRITTGSLPAPGPMGLRPVVLPGGLGAHKWADRALVESLSSATSTPLICDLDGEVLEAGYAAALIVEGDLLVAPPFDGRALPSVSRERALAIAHAVDLRVAIEAFTLERARAADAVILTSALRGPHPALLEGARQSNAAGAVCERLSRAQLLAPATRQSSAERRAS